MEDPIKPLLDAKMQALEKAKADVAELEGQVQVLKTAAAMLRPTGYEAYLAQQSPQTPAASASANTAVAAEVAAEAPQPARNQKGALTPVILDVLSDGRVRNMDEMLQDVNMRMKIPTSRDSLRSTLGNLKESKKVVSPGYGKYQSIPQEGESPAEPTVTSSGSEAFNLQPSPGQGH